MNRMILRSLLPRIDAGIFFAQEKVGTILARLRRRRDTRLPLYLLYHVLSTLSTLILLIGP